MKKALVLGATGGMGSAIVNELAGRGMKVKAFARGKEKLQRFFGGSNHIELVAGDAFHIHQLEKAAEQVDVIFHAMNLPYYEWPERQPRLMRNVVQAAEKHGCKLAIADNIYAYGGSNQNPVTEDAPKQPHTKKGSIRLELEQIAKSAKVPVLIAHFPDFYGPQAENTVLHYTLHGMKQNKKPMFVGRMDLGREYIYTPDGAKAIVELAQRDDCYGENWNIPGAGLIKGEEIIAIAANYLGTEKRKAMTVTKNMIRMLGLFDKQMREVVEMYYLMEKPVWLSGEKYEQRVGMLPRTPYQEGIQKTLECI